MRSDKPRLVAENKKIEIIAYLTQIAPSPYFRVYARKVDLFRNKPEFLRSHHICRIMLTVPILPKTIPFRMRGKNYHTLKEYSSYTQCIDS